MNCEERYKSLSVLFVEDEKNVVKLMQGAIGDLFAKFFVAYDGQEALDIYDNNQIDIIISDIMMPNMDGLEMAKIVRESNMAIPIIILSAFSEKERLLSAIDIGIDKYLIKPIDPDELLQSICILAKRGHLGERFLNLFGEYRYDLQNQALYKKDNLVLLTGRELKFISLLCSAQDNLLPHRELKRKVWKDSSVSSAAIRAFIKRLRQKTDKELIVNIPKIGYKISLGLS
jgi:DNA-binding response OmpR family regulator